MTNLDALFENQPNTLTPEQAAAITHSSRVTVYDWHYRPEKYGIPKGMFLKFGRKLIIRTDMFKEWFISRTSVEECG